MSSTLPYFNLDFYKEESTTSEDIGVLKTWKECYEEAVYETLLESKTFKNRVERAERLLKEDPSHLAILTL